MAMASRGQCPMLSLALLLIAFALSLASPVLGGIDPSTQASIDRICRQLEDYGFCNNLYHAKLSDQSSDMHGLAQIAQQEATNKAAQIRLQIMDLLDKATEEAVVKALKECLDAYNTVIYQFQKAWFYFKLGSYREVLDIERIAPRAQASCSTTFDTPPSPENPIAEPNREERILIAMALVSTSYLTK